MTARKTVLVLCTGNSCRSQMAEAIINHDLASQARALSAGTRPQPNVADGAMDALRLAGLPTDGLFPKDVDAVMNESVDLVVTVCDNAKEACPVFPHPVPRIHLPFHDPHGEPLESFIKVRDDIRTLLIPAVREALSTQETGLPAQCEITAKAATGAPMSIFERYLTVWVFLCIVAGITLGQFIPTPFHALGRMEVARVNIPVGLLIWVMIIPMLVKVDFGALHEIRQHFRGIGVTLFVNWLVKPFSMAFLGWLFVRNLFAPMLPAGQLDSYIAGLILLAAAPCTAMVFVWSRLSNGDPLFTLSQVALNDTIMVFAFAPIVGLLLGISAIAVPWDTLLASVVLYIVIPLALAQAWRKSLLGRGQAHFDAMMEKIGPWSISALLATLVLLFAFQGKAIIEQPLVIVLLAVPILIQVVFNSALAYWLNRAAGEKHNVACPSALIGASNFFELAVATAISLFGFESGAALATVVGVLIEVPVMLFVVKAVNASKDWYERR